MSQCDDAESEGSVTTGRLLTQCNLTLCVAKRRFARSPFGLPCQDAAARIAAR